MHAREDLHQRRLAGAVVADQRHHLAGMHVELDVGQRRDRAEMLRDAAEAQDRLGFGHAPQAPRWSEDARPRTAGAAIDQDLLDAELLAALGIAVDAEIGGRAIPLSMISALRFSRVTTTGTKSSDGVL